jgi:hypothetical protein
MNRHLGYCTNVHAGADLSVTRANLQRHALAVRQRVCPTEPLGIGLWLSASSARSLREPGRLDGFSTWLEKSGLLAYTINGFPYGDFHRKIVKHDVYRPTWCDPARVDYTQDLIAILHTLLPEGMEGSISTLPLQWGTPAPDRDQLQGAAENLSAIADRLSQLEQQEGRLIYLCIEPEPGCALQCSADVVAFFRHHLLPNREEDRIRRYLRVCHDICHAAVMFEDQAEAIAAYRDAGISIGKVQVSSAIELCFDRLEHGERTAAIDQLRQFAEDRYLHQTVIQPAPNERTVFFEDLPQALALVEDPRELAGLWRTHFHVPIYLEGFGLLETTQRAIRPCVQTLDDRLAGTPLEVETYAWSVLPEELQQPVLADGIACELRWFRQLLEEEGLGA